MQLKCIAIDDEPLALNLLREYASRFPMLTLLRTFDDAIAGTAYLQENQVDLLFIDINMPDINGLQVVQSLEQKPIIVFTTAYRKFALEGFDLDAVDYLLKPISIERFEKAVNKATDAYSQKNLKLQVEDMLFVRSGYQLVAIDLNDIEYIECLQDYLKIHLVSEKSVMTLMTVKNMLQKLPASRFKRIHRSYIIPLTKVRSYANRKVKLISVELPVSDSYTNFWVG